MLDPEATAIITGAAGNLVAYMLTGQIDAARSRVRRIFQGGSEEEKNTSLRTVEDDSNALAHGTTSESDVRSRWSSLLTAYLAEHPETITDIEAVATSPTAANDKTSIGEQHNHGSGIFIGRDNHGDISRPGDL